MTDPTIEALFHAERQARIARNLPPDHVLDISEYPFAFAKEEIAAFERTTRSWTENHPTDPNAYLGRVMAALIRKDYADANAQMELVQRVDPADPRARMRFGHAPASAAPALPPVSGDYPKGPAIFISSDRVYFKNYVVVLLRTIARNAPGTAVHIHLMHPDTSVLKFVDGLPLKLTCTSEDPTDYAARHGIRLNRYCGAARLVRFAEALDQGDGPLLMVDADCMAGGDPRELLTPNAPALGLRVRPGRIEPWNQFSACFVLGSRAARPYFRRVAEIISCDLPSAWWGMDQYALFSAILSVPTPLALVGPDVASVDPERPGLFWYTAGAAKDRLLTDMTLYARTYRKYGGMPEPDPRPDE